MDFLIPASKNEEYKHSNKNWSFTVYPNGKVIYTEPSLWDRFLSMFPWSWKHITIYRTPIKD